MVQTSMDTAMQLIHKAYDAFNNRDIDAVLQLLQPDVQWPNGWEGGWVNGWEEVREYWTRQWQEIDPHVTPVSLTEKEDDRVAVQVHQVVKDKNGLLLADGYVMHIYTFENELVQKMEIEPTEL
jgi:nuclear transport factor 2 (NTF2) superfamily protein